MSALKARLYQPDPPKPREWSFSELVRRLEKNEPMPSEALFGDRGTDIGQVRLSGIRAMNTGTDTAGGFLVDSKQWMTAIEYLGAILIAARAGAVSIRASAADFSPMPKEVTPPTLYWVTDGNPPPTFSDGVWGTVAPNLKTGVVWSDLTRLMSVITGGAADRIVTRAFFKSVARGVDHVFFHGAGGEEPLGIVNIPNVGSVAGGTFSLLKACSMLKAVEDANAENISWCMSPDVAEILRQREKGAAGEPRYLFEDGKILDKPALVSNSIDAGTLFCGDFSNATILNRSLELLVDRSSGSTSGTTRLLVFWHGDVIVTTPEAFCFAQGVS